MENPKKKSIFTLVFGKRYEGLEAHQRVDYVLLFMLFAIGIVPLAIFGFVTLPLDGQTAMNDFFLASLLAIGLIMIRSRIPLIIPSIVAVIALGIYALAAHTFDDTDLWQASLVSFFPIIAFILLSMKVALIVSTIVFIIFALVIFLPGFVEHTPTTNIGLRILVVYSFTMFTGFLHSYTNIRRNEERVNLLNQVTYERDLYNTMGDNIDDGIILFDSELKIQSGGFTKAVIKILSWYDTDLTGKNFLDILSGSLNVKQLQVLQKYFRMISDKTKDAALLKEANPISEFEYKIDGGVKVLSTTFHLIEDSGRQPMIIGVLKDITLEKEFEKEMQAQKDIREQEVKNMVDLLKIDPVVFQDFIDDTDANFNYINETLKDSTLDEREVVTRFFQNIHAIKSNAVVLGLETFGTKLHELEEEIKAVLHYDVIANTDILVLTTKLEVILQIKDGFLEIIKKVEAYKASRKVEDVLINSLKIAVERIAAETNKEVEIKAGQLDREVLESDLRKPIKDILFQCIRNSIFHGIEPAEERRRKEKDSRGVLSFTVKKIGGSAELNFSDDGSGLNWESIKEKYHKIYPEAKEEVAKNKLLAAIFSPEFSTSDEITSVAGRGVGLSLVKKIVKENHGAIVVNSSDSGLTFKFTFPFETEAAAAHA